MNQPPVSDPFAPLSDDHLSPTAERVLTILTTEGPTLARGVLEGRVTATSREVRGAIRQLERAGVVRVVGQSVRLAKPDSMRGPSGNHERC